MTIIADAMARDAIGKIADNIEIRGHYQGRGDTPDTADPKQPVCVLLNPAWPENIEVRRHMMGLLLEEFSWYISGRNDSTPTDILLADLRRIAAKR